jgi:ketosteroid isomerase-like protein
LGESFRADMNDSLVTVNAFLKLTSGAGADIDGATDLLADDVQFIGPLMQTSGKNEYATLLRQFSPTHVAARVLQQFVQDEHVCSIDEFVLRTPSGGTLTLVMAQWFRLRGGKIAEHRVFYDPRDFAAAFRVRGLRRP